MEKTKLGFFLGLLIMVSVFSTSKTQEFPEDSSLSTYIVHVKKPQSVASLQSEELHGWYQSFLLGTTEALNNQQRMVFSYRNVVSGFAAKLTAEEARVLQEKDEILSARPERTVSLHTTRTPTFLGLQQGKGLWEKSNLGKGIIIGIVDTGIYPLHPSFSDEGMDPPPEKWKGFCEFTGKRTCNNKLIGARNIVKTGGLEPPFEEPLFIHGSHTSAEAAGRIVRNASVLGEAMGTAVGMAPEAHIAMYKVCNSRFNCSESAILAAMDIAIEDGVDVLSLSLGSHSLPFYQDSLAVGAFAAVQKGIFVSCSAGNSGPNYTTLSNEAPWILTVGASTIDRNIKATAMLGNGAVYDGQSLLQPNDFSSTLTPLIYPGANGSQSSVFCGPGSLENLDVKGKVVLCDLGNINITGPIREVEVRKNGGVGIILVNQQSAGFSTFSTPHIVPTAHLSYAAGLEIKDYIKSTPNPTATILFKGTVIGDSNAPSIVFFSSRGPSNASPGILKPDITGPGVNILAAWPASIDNKIPQFNVISGTSMSCPHLSGIAALLKNSHPDWSPAAIKSAIMTTADVVNHGGQPILDQRLLPADIFATGAGHVNPEKANDPGLVFDIELNDYISYLCGLGYNNTQVSIVVQKPVTCFQVKSIPEAQLNYPSISIKLGSTSLSYTRTVTNVGPANSTYTAKLDVPLATGMSVNPAQLTFTRVKQKATFSLEFIPQMKENRGNYTFAQGSLTWVSEKHSVRMPIAIIFK